MTNDKIQQLTQGLQTAFIDQAITSNLAYKPQFVSNNYKEGRKVISSIEDELLSCNEFYISVAFITQGGITPLLQTLRELEQRGIPGKILTTDYLTFSEPKALRMLANFKNIELKMFMSEGSKDGFHTKGYIFKKWINEEGLFMTLQEVVARFNTTPFLFAGSGITRRYYGLPDWVGLLTHFAEKVKNDQFAFRYYESKVSELEDSDKLPTIASYIEKDFNEAWFNNLPGIRSESENVQRSIAEGVSPFKAEIAEYINSISVVKNEYQEEVKKLQNIAKNNISGVITTNYDCFFEILFDGYKTFIGQDELVFSQLQGVAEIYKIHGSVRSPLSIVINKNDYHTFREKGKYLAAKLMTIFMEYPIVFIGYSISDSDIQEILGDVVECLPPEKVNSLQKRFIFIDYQKDTNDCEVSSHSLVINGKLIEMTKIILSDFGILYDALSAKKAALPVKLLRRFKDELYSFALTQQPGPTMQVAALDDGRIDENMLALSIGLASTGVYGLARAVNSEQWYRNIILHDSMYSCDKLLEYVYPELAKQNSWKLPVWYYIANSDYKSSLAESKAPHSYNDIVSEDSIKRNRTAIAGRTAMEIWTQEKTNVFKAIRLLGFLPEDKIDVEQYQQILETIFKENANILSSSNTSDRSSLKRMIRIYDFLLYRQKKTP